MTTAKIMIEQIFFFIMSMPPLPWFCPFYLTLLTFLRISQNALCTYSISPDKSSKDFAGIIGP
jgi:hypothetical protein